MRSLIALFALAIPAIASAHVSISSGPAAANKSQIITFAVGHGCEGDDTIKVKVTIPAGVTGVRGLRSDFGNPTYTKAGTAVTAVTWTKPVTDLQPGDDSFYELKLRARVPDAPFTKLQWNIEQTCEDAVTHEQTVVHWDQPEGSTTGEPAAQLSIVPVRSLGWNKITVPRALTMEEVAVFLGDALIVWRGNAAYSSNPNTAAMITSTQGVTALDAGLAANDEIWVRY